MRTLLAAGLLVMIALSGCADDGVSKEEANRILQEENAASDGPNRAPILTFTTSVESGEVPLEVRFQIQPQDVDGQELTFALDVDGDGESDAEGRIPHSNSTYEAFNFTHTYTRAGSYNVTAAISDGEATARTTTVIEALAPGASGDPDFIDRGWYLFEVATGQCHVKDYQDVAPGLVYVATLSGGTWVLVENNGVEGLQVEDNHPLSDQGAGFELDIPDCTDGDLVAV